MEDICKNTEKTEEIRYPKENCIFDLDLFLGGFYSPTEKIPVRLYVNTKRMTYRWSNFDELSGILFWALTGLFI